MKANWLGLFKRVQELLEREDGQDLVEYSLVVSLIALATITGMQALDNAIMQVVSSLSAVFASAF